MFFDLNTMDGKLRAFENILSALTSKDAQLELLLAAFREQLNTRSKELQPFLQLGGDEHQEIQLQSPPDFNDLEYAQGLFSIAKKLGLADEIRKELGSSKISGLKEWENSWSKPLDRLPCANVVVLDKYKCPNLGVRACTGCRLVSYCSTVRLYLI